MPTPDTFAEWLRDHPLPAERFRQTVAAVARRTIAGQDFRFAVRELLDEVALRPVDRRADALASRPPLTGDARQDAFLGALAEHLALVHDLERPAWTVEPERFLPAMWFVSDVPGFRATALRESPAAFRRRGVFISAGLLTRV